MKIFKRIQPITMPFVLSAQRVSLCDGAGIFFMQVTNSQKRSLRLKIAKGKGDHCKEEWLQMLEFFDYTCCACMGEMGWKIQKDHIIPVYQGGSNHIRNIQPLCSHCNASKGPDISDWSPQLADFLGKQLPELYTNPY